MIACRVIGTGLGDSYLDDLTPTSRALLLNDSVDEPLLLAFRVGRAVGRARPGGQVAHKLNAWLGRGRHHWILLREIRVLEELASLKTARELYRDQSKEKRQINKRRKKPFPNNDCLVYKLLNIAPGTRTKREEETVLGYIYIQNSSGSAHMAHPGKRRNSLLCVKDMDCEAIDTQVYQTWTRLWMSLASSFP